MVTKHNLLYHRQNARLNLAKIHMVTKQTFNAKTFINSLNLAKIHMVTKRPPGLFACHNGLNLAKIHMVTKHEKR